MAYYAALASVVQLMEEISHGHHPYHNYLTNNKQIIEPLHKKFDELLAALKDYSSKGNEASDDLERRIRDVAYEAQDMIESPQTVDDIHGAKRLCYQLISASQGAVIRPRREAKELQALQNMDQEVDSILKYIKEIRGTEDLQLNYHHPADIGESNNPPLARNTIVGLDEHLLTIQGQLCEGSSKLQVIPIVGMGGIGKTTLARKIFDDKLIVQHFEIRVWITVSQDYHISKIVKTALNSINEVTGDLSEQQLCVNIYQHFKRRRYLIILDDVWSIQVLDDVRRIFPDDGSRSRIMLTTRISDVANYGSAVNSRHEIQFLNTDQSWNLLRVNVFAHEHCPHELEDLGKLIASNCRGLPLAIIVVAGLLSQAPQTRYSWGNIAKNVYSAAMSDEHFKNILLLSYNHLPHHLKPCFLYIGVFPEDYEISVSRLIRLWVAEGFLKPIPNRSLEEVGYEYLEELVKRNLVFITKKRSNQKFKFCSIQNLLRSLCSHRVRSENFFQITDENGCFYPRVVGRRACIYPSQGWSSVGADEIGSRVRSMLCLEYPQTLLSLISGFSTLRVLDALEIIFSSFPDEILELVHLRYLAFRIYTRHTITLPSIAKLQSLQTLIIEGFISLPSQFWTMTQLRHVLISNMSLSPYDDAISSGEDHVLQNLETLLTVENFIFVDEAIKLIPILQKLKIRCTGSKSNSTWLQYCLHNLVLLRKLEKLEIMFLSNEQESTESFPQSFEFPLNLKKLSLSGCKLVWTDMHVLGSLFNLEVLKLLYNAVVGEEWRTFEGEFQSLKFLVLEDLDLKYWRADDSTHFPRLVHLEIRYCKNLSEIPLEIGDIPTLQLIKVCSSRSASHSAMRIQQLQQENGNDTLQVLVQHR